MLLRTKCHLFVRRYLVSHFIFLYCRLLSLFPNMRLAVIKPSCFGSGGDYSQNYICDEYYAYWQKAQYLGFPAGGQNKSRSYTPYVIDTVRVYFDICDKLLANNKTISRENVLAALRGSAESPMFQGCTGLVAIDPLTGSRSTTHQPPIYDLVSLTPTAWEVTFTSTCTITSMVFVYCLLHASAV